MLLFYVKEIIVLFGEVYSRLLIPGPLKKFYVQDVDKDLNRSGQDPKLYEFDPLDETLI